MFGIDKNGSEIKNSVIIFRNYFTRFQFLNGNDVGTVSAFLPTTVTQQVMVS